MREPIASPPASPQDDLLNATDHPPENSGRSPKQPTYRAHLTRVLPRAWVAPRDRYNSFRAEVAPQLLLALRLASFAPPIDPGVWFRARDITAHRVFAPPHSPPAKGLIVGVGLRHENGCLHFPSNTEISGRTTSSDQGSMTDWNAAGHAPFAEVGPRIQYSQARDEGGRFENARSRDVIAEM